MMAEQRRVDGPIFASPSSDPGAMIEASGKASHSVMQASTRLGWRALADVGNKATRSG